MQPLLLTQPQRSQPGVEHHEEDAGQGEGDGKEGGFEATDVVAGRGINIEHYVINFSTFIVRFERLISQHFRTLQFCHNAEQSSDARKFYAGRGYT